MHEEKNGDLANDTQDCSNSLETCEKLIAQHEKFMRDALTLARNGAGHVHPNPMVGAVIVRDGKIIGRGWHKKCGQPHAEVNAVADARANGYATLAGTTIYVTLEPCCHTGRTPPCTNLILSSGISSVVIGMTDPNPLVAGKGIEVLRAAGINVTCGILETECKELNHIFIKYITKHAPYVLLKSACSLDGKTATASGESKWISCNESRQDAHRLRNEYTAIMCGINTVLADDPMLNVRIDGARNESLQKPVRIVVDSRLRIPLNSQIVQSAREIPTILATTEQKDRADLSDTGVTILRCANKDGRVDLVDLMKKLGAMEIDSILLEGGGTLAFSALQDGIVDRVRFYIAPILVGGTEAKTVLGGTGIQALSDAFRLSNVSVGKSGCDIIVEGDICSRE